VLISRASNCSPAAWALGTMPLLMWRHVWLVTLIPAAVAIFVPLVDHGVFLLCLYTYSHALGFSHTCSSSACQICYVMQQPAANSSRLYRVLQNRLCLLQPSCLIRLDLNLKVAYSLPIGVLKHVNKCGEMVDAKASLAFLLKVV
jgi:hypothetical protein